MPEEVVKPIEACSIGAAWQQESVSTIVDRLPFSITMRWESGESNLYRAFTPTVAYKTLKATPLINPFKSGLLSLPSGCKEISVVHETPDGETEVVQVLRNLPPGSYVLEIDLFGRCIIRDGLGTPHEVPNPSQHPTQKALWALVEEERQREEEEDKKRTIRYATHLPGEDLHEVG